MKTTTRANNAKYGKQYFITLIQERIDEENERDGYKQKGYGYYAKKMAGWPETKIQRLHFYCESMSKQTGKPYGLFFNAKLKK